MMIHLASLLIERILKMLSRCKELALARLSGNEKVRGGNPRESASLASLFANVRLRAFGAM